MTEPAEIDPFEVVLAAAGLEVPADRRAALRDDWLETMRFVAIVRAADLPSDAPEGFDAQRLDGPR